MKRWNRENGEREAELKRCRRGGGINLHSNSRFQLGT